jgi:predicted kinase
MASIIMVMGLPGSGKSFFAKRLSDHLGAAYIGSDGLRRKMGLMGNYRMASKKIVYDAMFENAQEAILDQGNLVLDSTFFLQEIRDKAVQLAKKHGAVLIPILVKAEKDIIRERLAKKRVDSEADIQVYQKIKEAFEPIKGPYLTILSTNDNIEEIMNQALHYIKNQDEKKRN